MQLFHKNNNKNSLLIFFSGWALDYSPFAHLFSDESDLLFVWDYRNCNFEFDFSKYERIDVVAFSYGVFMSQFVSLPIFNSFTAINGTHIPINKNTGINPKIFDLTLKNLNEITLEKFYKNMFLSEQDYTTFKQLNTQKINIDGLKEELKNIKQLSERVINETNCTKAVISSQDKIISTTAQNNFWADKIEIKKINSGHFPFYSYNLKELLR